MNKSLAEIATIHNGTDYKHNPPGDTVPIYGTGGLMGYTSIALHNGAAVLSGRKGSINNPIFVEGDFWNVDTIFCIKANEGVDTKWLYYNFLNTDLSKLNEATGVPSVNSKALYKLKFNWVEFPEQQEIARILSTADAVIEKTRAAIAKYKAVKQGMLHDLFTRGIDSQTKTLRPKPEVAPELYKNSPLGKVPKDWDIKRFDEITDILTCGLAATPKYVSSGVGIPFLSAQNVQDSRISLLKFSYISKEFHKELTKTNKPQKGDILYSRVGAGFGQAAVVGFDWEFSVYVSLTLIRMTKGYNNYFYSYLLNSKPYKNKASIDVYQGGGVPNLNVAVVRDFEMICPQITEQIEIARRLQITDAKIQTEQSYLAKLQSIKAGLMADLLSGKKSVKIGKAEN